MKKKCLLLLSLLLIGCANKDITKEIKIICPTGAPALAFYNYALNDSFETNSVPDNITSLMTNKSPYTVAVIDTVSGMELIRNGAPYKIAANITFGNYYIVQTGNDDDRIMNLGDTVLLFGKNKTPDYLFKYLYPELYSSVRWVDSVTNIKEELLNPTVPFDYAFIAEPAMSTINKANIVEYKNIQSEFNNKSGLDLVQASIFIKNNLDEEIAKEFLLTIKNNISSCLLDPTLIANGLDQLSNPTSIASIYGVSSAIAKKLIQNNNRVGLGYKDAIENKTAIDNLLTIFGKETSNEKDYF